MSVMKFSISIRISSALLLGLLSLSAAIPTQPSKAPVLEQDVSQSSRYDPSPLSGLGLGVSHRELESLLFHSDDQQATPTLTTPSLSTGGLLPRDVCIPTPRPDGVLVCASEPASSPSASTSTGGAGPTNPVTVIGSIPVTLDPTGFPIGSTTLRPGSTVVVGTITVSLGQSGTLFENGVPVATLPPPQSQSGPPTNSGPKPTSSSTNSQSGPSNSVSMSGSGSKSASGSGSVPSGSTSGSSSGSAPLESVSASRSGSASVSKTGSASVSGSGSVPTASASGSGSASVSASGSASISAGLTVVSDDSTTETFGIATLTDLQTLTTQTIVTTQYFSTDSAGKTQTTTGAVFVAPGGVVILHTPVPPIGPGPGSGIIDPIVPPPPPGPGGIVLKCPKILAFICGPGRTSGSDSGSDVDPADTPENPTKSPSASSSNTQSKSCSTSRTASDCTALCTPTTPPGASTPTITCYTTACKATTGCSVTGSTTSTTSTASCSGIDCSFGSRGHTYDDTFLTSIDDAALASVGSSILLQQSSYASLLAAEVDQSTITSTSSSSSSTTSSSSSSTSTSAPPSKKCYEDCGSEVIPGRPQRCNCICDDGTQFPIREGGPACPATSTLSSSSTTSSRSAPTSTSAPPPRKCYEDCGSEVIPGRPQRCTCICDDGTQFPIRNGGPACK